MSYAPFFSIIIVSYNAENTIKQTVESVLSQDFSDYEIIVKDAGSADRTLELIPNDTRIKVFSERDNGIYNGMNIAGGYASGKYLLFLNCGDRLFADNVLSEVYNQLKDDENTAVAYGNYSRNNVEFRQPATLSEFYLYRTPLCHQTEFFNREIFNSIGWYDEEYKILADYELALKAFFLKEKFRHISITVCGYLGGGVSESKKGKEIKNREYKVIRRKYFSKSHLLVYGLAVFFSFKSLRGLLISDKSPEFVRRLYRKLVDLVNSK